MQAAPLNVKVMLTKQRIRDWVNHYGEEGVYVSFSGGKDSTVLLTLVREMYPNVPAVFCDTGLEYPEIREFVKTWDNVVWLKPKMNFRQVIEKYGYPMISKEVAECVWGARKYLTRLIEEGIVSQTDRQTDRQTDIPYRYRFEKLCGRGEFESSSDKGGYDNKYRKLRGLGIYSNGRNLQRQADIPSCPTRGTGVPSTNEGGYKSFSDLVGIRASDNSIDTRLYQSHRQCTDSASHGDSTEQGQSDSGEYP